MSTIGGSAPLGSSSKIDASRTKVVIRRLPPTLPEETFWKSVEPWVSDATCLWKRFVKGSAGEGLDSHPVFSRAYVLFKAPETVVAFHRDYDGHVFRSKAGAEFQAVVELAPIQKTPHNVKAKVDARQGTIDTEPDYLSFLEILKNPVEKPVVDIAGPIAQPTTTPLLEHLRKHGKVGKGASRSQKSASSSDVRGRAIASVTAAAAKRAPHADSGPIMVAGKGREVKITALDSIPPPSTPAAETNGEGKKKRNRNRGGAKGPAAATAALGEGVAPSEGGSSTSQLLPKPAKHAKPKQEKGPAKAPTTEGETTLIQPGSSQIVEGRGGRRGRGGGGGGGGRGKADGKDRTARGAVVSILSKNSEEGGGRGGGPGRGRGRGRGGGSGGAEAGPRDAQPSQAAAMARIDG